MLISLKNIIGKHPKPSSGIFTFFDNNRPLKLIIADRDGNPVSSYQELKEMLLSDAEVAFAKSNWEKIKEKNPSFYDGDVTAVIDVIYDDTDRTLTFLMDKTKYSRTCAMYQPEYPVSNRFKEFVSFGLGLMSNLEVGSDGSFLMVERSGKVYTEKFALSVPGGSLEYKKDGEKVIDDVAAGLESAAAGEIAEEILGKKNLDSLKVEIESIAWNVNAQGRCALNAYFKATTKNPMTRGDIYDSFKNAPDKDESTGNFYFVNPYANIQEAGENHLYATPLDVINLEKLQVSGTAALATQVYGKMYESYNNGKYSGLMPHPGGIATHFPNFNIFDVIKMCNNNIERPPSDPATPNPRTTVMIPKNKNDQKKIEQLLKPLKPFEAWGSNNLNFINRQKFL